MSSSCGEHRKHDVVNSWTLNLKVYNVRGRFVATLEDGPQVRGRHQAIWLGQDNRGANVASGVYFVKFKAAGQEFLQKVTLVR